MEQALRWGLTKWHLRRLWSWWWLPTGSKKSKLGGWWDQGVQPGTTAATHGLAQRCLSG